MVFVQRRFVFLRSVSADNFRANFSRLKYVIKLVSESITMAALHRSRPVPGRVRVLINSPQPWILTRFHSGTWDALERANELA